MADEMNGLSSNGKNNGGGNAPAVHISKPGAKQDIRQNLIRDPFPIVPHVATYAGLYNSVNKDYYIYFDEALRSSQQNTLAMRRDGYVHELIRHRQMPIVSLPFHIEVDDPEHPDQISISHTVHKIFSDIPRLKSMMMILMEAIFYGKYAVQVKLGPRKVGGNTFNSIVGHLPVNGDKLRYRWSDGTPGISIYAGADGKNGNLADENAYLVKYKDCIHTTMLGPALFLENEFLRDRFVIHNFEPFDTDYLFEIDESLSVHGLGLRSRLYWTWNLRTELLSWMMDALQRVGANGLLYGFSPPGNPQLQIETLNALKMLVKDNISVFPLPPNNKDQLKDVIQNIAPSSVGYDVMMKMIEHLEGIMRRAFLGQELSSKSSPTGIGGGASGLQSDVRQDYKEYDANSLAETLTTQPMNTIIRYNDWKYEEKVYKGYDLPFSMRLIFDIDKGDGPQRLESAKALFDMGVPLDQDDVRKVAGFSPPKKRATALINHNLEQVKQTNEAGQPAFNELNKHMKGLVDTGKKAKGMGMLPGGNGSVGKSRFAKPADDCGHDNDGYFSKGNTCAYGGRQRSDSWKDEQYPFKHREAVLKLHDRFPDDIHGSRVPELKLRGVKRMYYNVLKSLHKPNNKEFGGVKIERLADHVLGPYNDKFDEDSRRVFDDIRNKYSYKPYTKEEWKSLEPEDRRKELHAVARAKAFSRVVDELVHSGKVMATVKDEGGFEPEVYIRHPNKHDTQVSGSRHEHYMKSLNSFAESLGKSKFTKADDYKEGEDEISDRDQVLTRLQVGKILAEQHDNVRKNFNPEYMADRWLGSKRYRLHHQIPIWPLSCFKPVDADDRSYSTGPIIVDSNASGDKRQNGSFGCDNIFRCIDGKHRIYDAIREGKTHLDAYIGNSIYYSLMKYIEEFGPKRERFAECLDRFYDGHNNTFDYCVRRLVDAGEECGLDEGQLNELIEKSKIGIKFNIDLGIYE